MTQKNILKLLTGGDRRSLGRADEVAEMVSADTKLFPSLMRGLWNEDTLVRMRAADAAEKVTREKRELLRAYKKELLGFIAQPVEQEVRWHLIAMVTRLPLNVSEREFVFSILNDFLNDRSAIVKTFALQGLADMAQSDEKLRPAVIETLREASRGGTPAMKARAKKLLLQIERDNR